MRTDDGQILAHELFVDAVVIVLNVIWRSVTVFQGPPDWVGRKSEYRRDLANGESVVVNNPTNCTPFAV